MKLPTPCHEGVTLVLSCTFLSLSCAKQSFCLPLSLKCSFSFTRGHWSVVTCGQTVVSGGQWWSLVVTGGQTVITGHPENAMVILNRNKCHGGLTMRPRGRWKIQEDLNTLFDLYLSMFL